MFVAAREHDNLVLENSFESCYVSHIFLGLSGAGSIFLHVFLESSDSYFFSGVHSVSLPVFRSSLDFKQCKGSVKVVG